jgi:predicted enzyme related to lactoylglutathione lyase
MFTRLTPILPVLDVRQELAFYEQLGFEQHSDPNETYPLEDFAAVTNGEHILFGLSRHGDRTAVPAVGLDWQFEATDLESVDRAAASAGFEVVQPITLEPWGRKAMTIRSPSGYLVRVEEP